MSWIFEYPVSRPYPFRFYTVSVIFLFLIATILLSLFNTIIVGYELRINYSRDPNNTIAQKMWYDRPGFGGINKLAASCEPKEINVQQKFNTNKNGFIYSLNSVSSTQGTRRIPAPSMLYLNNELEDCTINYIKIEMAKHMGRTAQQVAWQRFGPQVLAAISCSVTNLQGTVRFNLTTEYDLAPAMANKRIGLDAGGSAKWMYAAQQNLFQLVISNNTNDPAMWWAESLMSFGWLDAALKMETAMLAQNFTNGAQWQSGTMNFWPSTNVSDIKSDSFFLRNFYMLQDDARILYAGEGSYPLNSSSVWSFDQMVYSADVLARSFYSAVSADLGQIHAPNILTDEAALQYFTKNYKKTNFSLIAAGPATDSYEALKKQTGQPRVTPSTIYTTYLCQTPQRKLTATLIISVLLADLVLLRALWSITTLLSTYIAKARDPNANRCAGCADYEFIPLSAKENLGNVKSGVSSQHLLHGRDPL